MPRTPETRKELRRLLFQWKQAGPFPNAEGALEVEAQLLGLTLIEDQLAESERGIINLDRLVKEAEEEKDLIRAMNWRNRRAMVQDDIDRFKERLANGEKYSNPPEDWPANHG